jgi:hypothetical protein
MSSSMPSSARMKEATAGGKRGEFLFVVHVAAPDGGFGRSLDAVNEWHRHGINTQHRSRPQRLAGREFCSWCREGLEIAKSLRHRFGGQIVPVTVHPVPPRRRDAASQISAAAEPESERPKQGSEKQTDIRKPDSGMPIRAVIHLSGTI